MATDNPNGPSALSPASSDLGSPSDSAYRPTAALPYMINERVRAALDETLYPSGIELISAISLSGVSSPTPQPARLPPPTFIRLLTTLIAHPWFTSQHMNKNRSHRHGNGKEASLSAPANSFLLLRRLLRSVGPSGLKLERAWEIQDHKQRERTRRSGSNSPREKKVSSAGELHNELAQDESMFALVDDIWSIVGFGFKASTAYPKRWLHWKPVLTILIEALERDWEEHSAKGESENMREALIVKLLPDGKGSAGYRRVLRSIFAGGVNEDPNRAHEFSQVFADEHNRKRKKRKRGGLGNYEAWDVESESDADEQKKKPTKRAKKPDPDDLDNLDADLEEAKPAPKKRKLEFKAVGEDTTSSSDEPEAADVDEAGDAIMADANAEAPNTAQEWGGIDAVLLRQRFMLLVRRAYLPEHHVLTPIPNRQLSSLCASGSYIQPLDLYNELASTFSSLPLPSFVMFMTIPTHSKLEDSYRIALGQILLANHLLSSEAQKHMPRPKEMDAFSQKLLVERYLPWSGKVTSVIDVQAKVAVVLEVLTRIAIRTVGLQWDETIDAAWKKGAKERRKKVESAKGKKAEGAKVAQAREYWENAESGLEIVLKVLKRKSASSS